LFLDSDDVMIGDQLAKQAEYLIRHPEVDYVYAKTVHTDRHLNPLPGRKPVGSPFARCPRDVAGYHWSIMGALYRHTFIKGVGKWNEQLTGSQDWEYQARIKLAGGCGVFVDAVVGYVRRHDGERVGARQFRPDYCRSAMVAFETILHLAREKGCCDSALEARLAKRIALVGLEWGANGFPIERQGCLDRAGSFLSAGYPLHFALLLARICPAWADGLAWRFLVGAQS